MPANGHRRLTPNLATVPVGEHYEDFGQTTNEEAICLLRQAQERRNPMISPHTP